VNLPRKDNFGLACSGREQTFVRRSARLDVVTVTDLGIEAQKWQRFLPQTRLCRMRSAQCPSWRLCWPKMTIRSKASVDGCGLGDRVGVETRNWEHSASGISGEKGLKQGCHSIYQRDWAV
jgi:hypothetical protein